MKTRKSWGMLAVAVVFAVGAIGTALLTFVFEAKEQNAGITAGGLSSEKTDADGDGLSVWEEIVWKTDPENRDSDGDGIPDGVEVLNGTNPSASGDEEYARATQSDTVSFIESVRAAETYITSNELEPEAAEALRAAAVESGAKKPDVDGDIPFSALRIGTNQTLSVYTQLVFAILKESTKVYQNELALFQKTIDDRNYSGTPALQQTALLYKKIAAALLAIEVRPEVANEHLALVNSINALANTVNLMAVWEGDTLQSLLYTDAYIREQNAVGRSAELLFKKISSVL